jgi:hypothetical protein
LAQTPYLEHLLELNLKSTNCQYSVKHNDDYDSELTDYDEEAEYKMKNIKTKQKSPKNVTVVDYLLSDDENNNNKNDSDLELTGKNNKKSSKQNLKNEKSQTHRSMRVETLNLTIKEHGQGTLIRYFYETIKQMKQSHSIISPSHLFGAVCKKYSLAYHLIEKFT